jgi:hypothetical protein
VLLPTKDRIFLETNLFPAFNSKMVLNDVLFIGVHWYTFNYQRYFPKSRFVTLDQAPWKRIFGAREHYVTRIENAYTLVAAQRFDLVICNGVWGWGLNTKNATETALETMRILLKPSGYLLWGWNNRKSRHPFNWKTCHNLKYFQPDRVGSIPHETHIDNFYQHVFTIFRKKSSLPPFTTAQR